MKIVLASSSSYRKEQLSRIVEQFDCVSPNIDESSLPNERPDSLSERLAKQKALAVKEQLPSNDKALIIASDQVAWCENEQLHKPGNRKANILQLQKCNGNQVMFYTSVVLLNSQTQSLQSTVETYSVKFRTLSNEQITTYVDKEPSYDCAGGFKMEGFGISLFESLRGDDPNSLIGLPLIKLISMLENEGICVLS